jgi:hypothetical protein
MDSKVYRYVLLHFKYHSSIPIGIIKFDVIHESKSFTLINSDTNEDIKTMLFPEIAHPDSAIVFKDITKAEYDMHVAFETVPVFHVKYETEEGSL